MKLTKDFSREEFSCNCNCGMDTVDAELLNILQRLRDYYKVTVIITSGNRCSDYNEQIGGAKSSYHTKSRAADFKVQGQTSEDVYKLLDSWYPDQYGLGVYSGWVHLDTRSGAKARWDMR